MNYLDTDLHSFYHFCCSNLESFPDSPWHTWPKQTFLGTCTSRRWHCVFDSSDGVHEQKAASSDHFLQKEESEEAAAF